MFVTLGVLNHPKSRGTSWPILVPVGTGVFLSLLALLWAPWERVHPADQTLRELIGYAPLWSNRFASTANAHIDWNSLLISLLVIWILCAVAAFMLKMSATGD